MNPGKTHFADDDTLKYIAELEGALKAAEPALRDACQATAIYGDQPPQMYLDALHQVRAVLAKSE